MTRLTAAVILGLALMSLACQKAAVADQPPPPAPTYYLLVSDRPCGEVMDQVARALKETPGLGLLATDQGREGRIFRLIPRVEENLRWEPVVEARCFEAQTTRVSVLVEALRKRPDGTWESTRDTAGQEREILEALREAAGL